MAEIQSRTILVTGANGQVGWELQRTLATLGRVVAIDVADLELTNPGAVRQFVRTLRPTVIVNPAAYTAVDKAEGEAERALAHAVNAVAPGVLAEEARDLKALFIHFSTDYVFDGSKREPWLETDAPCPLGVYGQTKLEGERAVLAAEGASLIFRTSWVYGTRGVNFLRRILELAREREELRIVDDQVGAPTWSRMLAEAIAQILAQGIHNSFGSWCARSGIYNLTSRGETTWYGFAKAFLELDARRSEQKLKRLVPITTAEYPTPAKRPAYSLLSHDRLTETFGIVPPAWDDQLKLVMCEFTNSAFR
jgi:dTDP-4-dehydrorhamnose reductase